MYHGNGCCKYRDELNISLKRGNKQALSEFAVLFLSVVSNSKEFEKIMKFTAGRWTRWPIVVPSNSRVTMILHWKGRLI